MVESYSNLCDLPLLAQPRYPGASLAEEIAETRLILNPGNVITYPSAKGEFEL